MSASAPLLTEPATSAGTLRPVLLSARDETERGRNLAPVVASALRDAGLFRLAVPGECGGLEAPSIQALEVYEELASAEAAAAWIVWNNTLPAILSRHLAANARKAIFADPQLVIANSTRPTGRAFPLDTGFRVEGRWSLVSGAMLANWILLRCAVEGAPPGPPQLVMVYLKRTHCRIEDTWHAGGLRGTGSHDVVVEGVDVPREHAIFFSDPVSLSGPLYRMPFAATLAAGAAAICLGIARTARDALVELGAKVSVDSGATLRDRPGALADIARMTARCSAARALLHSAVGSAWCDCSESRALSMQRRADVWIAAHHAAFAAREAVRTACDLAGTTSLYVQSPLERAVRDIQAVTQHIILRETWLEEAGRVILGMEPVVPMFAS